MRVFRIMQLGVSVIGLAVLLSSPSVVLAEPPDETEKGPSSEMTAEQRWEKINGLTQKLVEVAGAGQQEKALDIALEALGHARVLHDQLGERAESVLSMTNYNAACMYSLLNRKDEAFKHLDAAIEAGSLGGRLVDNLDGDDDLKNLRADSRYAAVVKKVEAQAEQAESRGEGPRGRGRRRMEDDGAPKAGQLAPPFSLKAFDGKGEVTLAGFREKQPVILFFGSYT